MKLIIDRFEEDYAVCEAPDGSHTDIAREYLPDGVCEGDVIEERDGVYFAHTDETAARRQRMQALMRNLFEEESD